MEILGFILGSLIVGGMILLALGCFAALFKLAKITREDKDSGQHDGWSDGTWYDAGSDGGD